MTFDEVRKFAAGYKWCPAHRLWTLHDCQEEELIFRENEK